MMIEKVITNKQIPEIIRTAVDAAIVAGAQRSNDAIRITPCDINGVCRFKNTKPGGGLCTNPEGLIVGNSEAACPLQRGPIRVTLYEKTK